MTAGIEGGRGQKDPLEYDDETLGIGKRARHFLGDKLLLGC